MATRRLMLLALEMLCIGREKGNERRKGDIGDKIKEMKKKT